MEVRLVRASTADAKTLWRMQVESFGAMLEKYQDYETNPAGERPDRTAWRLEQPDTYYYFILADGETVGAIRVIDKKDGSRKRISPLFVLPPFRNRGVAQAAMAEAERLHGDDGWELDTILQEKENLHLYEKMGYRQTGKTTVINDRMTLVFYQKDKGMR